jgi:hypothetical protein
MPKPFRWSIAKREQLGTLVSGVQPPLNRKFLSELRNTAARTLAMADDADLAFIGRTPENFYDYLSGAFVGLKQAPKLHLIQFSLRWLEFDGGLALKPKNLAALEAYLREEGLAPSAIARRGRPLALVDVVASGGTMRSIVHLLHLLSKRSRVDWKKVQRQLRIVGLVDRGKNSPNAWRWQQHKSWLHLIPDAVIKNVSADWEFIYYITGSQPKVTTSFHPGLWAEPESRPPIRDMERREAIALAAHLSDLGRTREERQALARCISRTAQMRQPATRTLALSLRQG